MTREEAQAVAILVAAALDTNGQARELLTYAAQSAASQRHLMPRQRWALVDVALSARRELGLADAVQGLRP